jgi:hypothetical protein
VDFATLFSEPYRARDHNWQFTYNGDSPTLTIIEDDSSFMFTLFFFPLDCV